MAEITSRIVRESLNPQGAVAAIRTSLESTDRMMTMKRGGEEETPEVNNLPPRTCEIPSLTNKSGDGLNLKERAVPHTSGPPVR